MTEEIPNNNEGAIKYMVQTIKTSNTIQNEGHQRKATYAGYVYKNIGT